MESLTLLRDLAVVMTIAASITILCHRFHLPVVLGYIIAGVLIGPNFFSMPLIKNPHSIEILSELGVVFLLFAIGLEFSFSKLMKVGIVAFVGATMEIILMTTIGYWLGRKFGWSNMDSIFLGAILSVSSTTIIAKVLMENKKLNEKFAQIILGILIIEDLMAIVIIAVLSGLAMSGTVSLNVVGISALRVVVFFIISLFIGFLVIPRLLRFAAKSNVSETLVVSVLGLCFAGALAAEKAGFSTALGAFLVGAIIAETKQIKKVMHQIEPIRDMFTAIFFVAVGMLIKPAVIAQFWLSILIITIVTILGKVVSCSSGTFLSGYKPDTAMMVGLGLSQIGEFSFIIANVGETTKVTSGFLYPIAVSVSAVTTLTTPLLMRSSPSIVTFCERLIPSKISAFFSFYTIWIQSLSKKNDAPKRPSLWQFIGANKIHARIEKMINDSLAGPDEKKTKSVHDELMKFIREEYPWEVEMLEYLVPFNESALNQRLSELRLRSETGASIVSICRGEETFPNPSADMRILPGDVVLILGNKDQVKTAVDYLQNKAREPMPQTDENEKMLKTKSFQVLLSMDCVGKTVAELRLKRKTGVTILGIKKEDRIINNPPAETVIETGDRTILFGWPGQLQAAENFLSKRKNEGAV